MARYSHNGHDTIRYDITQNIAIRYNTIRKCFTVCKNRKQARNSAQHWSTVVLPINTVAAAGAWIWPTGKATVVGDRRGDGQRAADVPWSPGLFSRATVSTGHQTIAAVKTLHSCYCLAATRLKYLVIAQSLESCDRLHSQHMDPPGSREVGQLLPISVTFLAMATLHETPFVDVTDSIDGNGDWELCRISTSFEG